MLDLEGLTYHATTPWTTIEPGGKRCRCGIASSLEEPEPPAECQPTGHSRRQEYLHVHVRAD